MVFILVLLSLLLVIAAVWAIHWAISKNQFDDLDSPAFSILDDDTPADRYQRRQEQQALAGESIKRDPKSQSPSESKDG